MAFQQISSLRKNRVYAPMILALAILLAIFVVRPVMSEYNDANATLNTLRSEIQEKEATLDRFLQMESELSQEGQTSLMGQIHKINRPFQAADILEAVMINEYTQSLIS